MQTNIVSRLKLKNEEALFSPVFPEDDDGAREKDRDKKMEAFFKPIFMTVS